MQTVNKMVKKELNIDTWNRKDHYYFFKDFDNPFYNICTEIEISELYRTCKAHNLSFFLASLFLTTTAANSIKELRLRIEGDKLFEYNTLHPFSTILNDDETFSFCELKLQNSFLEFQSLSRDLIAKVNVKKGLVAKEFRQDVIHFTTIPWIKINGMTHARKFNTKDSIPKIVFGKYFKESNKLMLPICIEVHHSLVDGYHLGKYFDKLRHLIVDSPNILTKKN